jgi:DeoR family transcriptional regulator of aga operon
MADALNRRCELIIKFLLRTGTATVEEILEVAGSSAPSIRRDLARLESRGLIRRTHGGATLVEPLLYEPFRYDSSFWRASSALPKKSAASAWPPPN